MNINPPVPGNTIAIPFTKAADPEKRDEVVDAVGAPRVPFAHLIPDAFRGHFVAMIGEFVGTVLFLYFALSGTQVANNIPSSSGLTVSEIGANPQQLQYIALCFGFSLAVNAWVFFRISGGLFNPAVTVGMCLIGALPWFRGALLFFAQIIAGIVASALVSCMFPGPLTVATKLGGGTSIGQGLFIEMILTAQLIFTIFMLAAEKHKGTYIAPVGIGLSLFVAELTGVYFTGGSLNPARSFGPAVVVQSFERYHWIYWLGPMLGSLLAAAFYKFIKALEYETANPNSEESDDSRRPTSDEQRLQESRHSYEEFAHKNHQEQNGLPIVAVNGQTATSPATNGQTPTVLRPQAHTRKSSVLLGGENGPVALPDDGLHGEEGEIADQWNSGRAIRMGAARRPVNRGASYQA
ncbi:Aquaporin-1 [Recurvomyces mirabilis]|nr:Aquaporin-1 [Recurvomyces mirabilis]